MLKQILDFYRKHKELNRLVEENKVLNASLNLKSQALSDKDEALRKLEKTLKDQEGVLAKRKFDYDIREILIEAREAANP